MDLYEYLKMDHKKVSHLFEQFEESNSEQRQREIVSLLLQELLIHAISEQETFYKALRTSPEINEEILHAKKEHEDIETQIKLITQVNKTKKNWKNLVLKLKDIVEHHVQEEEGKIFRRAKKIISDEESYIIKEKMHNFKQIVRKQLQQLDY